MISHFKKISIFICFIVSLTSVAQTKESSGCRYTIESPIGNMAPVNPRGWSQGEDAQRQYSLFQLLIKRMESKGYRLVKAKDSPDIALRFAFYEDIERKTGIYYDRDYPFMGGIDFDKKCKTCGYEDRCDSLHGMQFKGEANAVLRLTDLFTGEDLRVLGRVKPFLADNLFQFFKSGDIRKAIEVAVDKIPVCVPENINLPETTRGVYVEKNKVMEPTAPPYCGGYSTNDAINIYIQQSIHIRIR